MLNLKKRVLRKGGRELKKRKEDNRVKRDVLKTLKNKQPGICGEGCKRSQAIRWKLNELNMFFS